LKKKLSDKDKKDWENFINSNKKLDNKDKVVSSIFLKNNLRSIDLHGYSLEEANKKISSFVKECFLEGVDKINIITGKGLRSKNLDDPYKSNDLSILKYSVPEYLKNSLDLKDKILKIDFDSVNSTSKGNFDVTLKKKK
tara:strand:- start:1513 stop:1929 length:417 start_codon:yes stop_codon:yes gene_type:complete